MLVYPMLIRFVDKTCCAPPGGAWVYSGRAALLRGPNITAAQQRRPTGIVKQPDKHGLFGRFFPVLPVAGDDPIAQNLVRALNRVAIDFEFLLPGVLGD